MAPGWPAASRGDGAELETCRSRDAPVATGQVRLVRQKLSRKFAVLPGRLSTTSIFAPLVTLMAPVAMAWSATSELEPISHCSFEAEPKERVLPKFIVPTPSPGASVPVTVVAAVRVPRPARVAPEATVTAPEAWLPLMTSFPPLMVVAQVMELLPLSVQVPASFFEKPAMALPGAVDEVAVDDAIASAAEVERAAGVVRGDGAADGERTGRHGDAGAAGTGAEGEVAEDFVVARFVEDGSVRIAGEERELRRKNHRRAGSIEPQERGGAADDDGFGAVAELAGVGDPERAVVHADLAGEIVVAAEADHVGRRGAIDDDPSGSGDVIGNEHRARAVDAQGGAAGDGDRAVAERSGGSVVADLQRAGVDRWWGRRSCCFLRGSGCSKCRCG